MKKLTDKLNSMLLSAKFKADEFISDERGDTNFISIAIILAVVLVLAVAFINFGNQLLPKLNQRIQGVLDVLQ